MFLLLPIIVLFVWLEITITTLPLFLIGALIMLIIRKKVWVFVLAFLGGLILDISAVRFLGSSSLFFVGWLFFILLYERKYEIATIPFVFVSSFFGAFLYLWVFGYRDLLIQAGVSSIVAVLLFIMLRVRSAHQNFQFSIFNFH